MISISVDEEKLHKFQTKMEISSIEVDVLSEHALEALVTAPLEGLSPADVLPAQILSMAVAPLPEMDNSAPSTPPFNCLRDAKCPPCGKLLVCGRRREMEDTAAIVPSFAALPCDSIGGCRCDTQPGTTPPSDMHFFAVYDGHGGSEASNYCVERLHQALAEELAEDFLRQDAPEGDHPANGWGSKWEKAMASCFLKMDKEVGGVCPNGGSDDVDSTCTCCRDTIAPENVGTTAVVAVIGPCQIVVANCGDSRAVLSRGKKAIPLSHDHKPQRDDETSRIEAAGGRVIYWDGYRVGGLLALSRAIGDRYLKRYVISEPEVTCMQRTEEDECLILASDGLWDVISNELACEVARKALATARRKYESGTYPPGEDPAAASVAALLVKLAYGKGSKDNISVVVVDLTPRRMTGSNARIG